jgi:hypothetical protein
MDVGKNISSPCKIVIEGNIAQKCFMFAVIRHVVKTAVSTLLLSPQCSYRMCIFVPCHYVGKLCICFANTVAKVVLKGLCPALSTILQLTVCWNVVRLSTSFILFQWMASFPYRK